jgi:hypothetical protein
LSQVINKPGPNFWRPNHSSCLSLQLTSCLHYSRWEDLLVLGSVDLCKTVVAWVHSAHRRGFKDHRFDSRQGVRFSGFLHCDAFMSLDMHCYGMNLSEINLKRIF